MSAQDNLNPQQFYHGTNAQLRPGDALKPNHRQHLEDSAEGHIYFTDEARTARMFALNAAAKFGGSARVYTVQPQGDYEPDPEFDSEIRKNWGNGYRSPNPVAVTGGYRRPKGGWENARK
jgi:hypothetical protein